MGQMLTTSKQNGGQPVAGPGELPPHLMRAMSKVTEISSLPEITAKIVEVVEDPRATAHHMHEIVRNDPALATKILKVVNSAFYGLPAQIASLDRAIVMLGLSAVKNIALAASLARLFKPGSISDRFSARDLWRHCIAVGVCGRQLTKLASGFQHDEAFVAGLVHDLGLLVEFQLFPDKLREVVDRCSEGEEHFTAVEQQLIGADHTQFGAALATKWKFPPALRTVISHHHTPDTLKPEFQKIATIVHLADTICCELEYGFYLSGRRQPVHAHHLELLGIEEAVLAEMIKELPEQIEQAEQVFSDG